MALQVELLHYHGRQAGGIHEKGAEDVAPVVEELRPGTLPQLFRDILLVAPLAVIAARVKFMRKHSVDLSYCIAPSLPQGSRNAHNTRIASVSEHEAEMACGRRREWGVGG